MELSRFPRVPFFIGVTGNTDPDGYFGAENQLDDGPEVEAIRKNVFRDFDWLIGRDQHLAIDGTRSPQINHTPIGCEALNENAEWLTIHRARSLEPFMAG